MRDDLRYRIGGDTSGIDAAWGKIRRDAAATAGVINTAMGRARTGIEGVMAPLRAVPALFAAIGATAVIGAVRQTAEAVADVGREAKRAGVDVEAFQELKFVAEQNRIGVESLTDGLKELNLRADEFIATGKGPAAEAFGRLGLSAEDLARKLKDPSALFSEIIGKLETFDAAARIRIADEIFGGSAGERFVELVERGEQGIRDQIQAARDLGIVMDREMIAKAEAVDRKFNLLTTTVGTYLKGAIIDAATELNLFINSFSDFENQQTTNVQRELQRVYGDLDQAKRDLDEMQGTGSGLLAGIVANTSDEEDIRRQTALVEELTDKALMLRDILDRRQGYSPGAVYEPPAPAKTIDTSVDFIRRFREELTMTNRERRIAVETQRILNEASAEGAKLTGDQARELAEEKVAREEAQATRGASAETSDKEAEAIRRVIEELEHEQRLLGLNAVEQRVLNEQRRAGVADASAEGQAIRQKVEALMAEAAAQDRVTQGLDQRQQAYRSLFQMGEGALLSMIDNASSAEDALKRLVVQLGFAAAQAALLGTGPLAGLFGSGGFFGGGGFVPDFGMGLYEEGGYTGNIGRKKVAGLVHGEEFVANADATARYRPILEAMNAGHDIGLFSMNRTIGEVGERRQRLEVGLKLALDWADGAAGNLRPFVQDVSKEVSDASVARGLDGYDRQLPDRLHAISRDPRAR